ncbi:MAG TPA: TonB-dependent receptor [Dongiaceae bacterium]|nr:TonB-dependent receptor [Dongiaceae bacterium]
MKTRKFFSALAVLLSLFSVSPVFPQSNSVTSRITGNLTDPSGAPISGAHIELHLPKGSNDQTWSAVSASDGSFTVTFPPGRYRVSITQESFVRYESEIDVLSGATKTMDVRLNLATLSASVLVTGAATPITEDQSPAPSSIVSRQELEARQTANLPDVLIFTPGVAFGRTGANGGTASIFLDGGNSNFTKVLVDGSPINPPGGAVDFSILTADNLEKVEIVRGAESAVYGTDAVSGVVQLFTRRGSTRVPAFSLFSEGGSYGSVRGGGDISGLVDKFDYSASLSYLQTDGMGPNNDFENRTVSGNLGYSFTETNQVRLSLRDNSSEAGIPGQTLYTPPSVHQRVNQHFFTANARWNFATGPHWQHQLMGAESFTRQHGFNPEQSYYMAGPDSFCPQTSPTAVASNFCDYTYDSPLQFNRASVNAQSTYTARKFVATTGYQYEVENVENGSVYYTFEPHIRRNNQAGYLDFRYSPLSRLVLDVGVRAEANDYFGTRVVPRVGGSFTLHSAQGFWGDTRLKAFYGEGIKEPRFDQLESTDPCDPGNPSLKPEGSKNWSGGLDQKFAGDRIKLSADYFYYRFYNIVSFGPSTPPPGSTCEFYYTYFNTDLAFSRGTSVAAEARAAKWLLIAGNYTYDDTRVVKSPNSSDPALIAGNRLIRRPLNSGSISFIGSYRNFSAVFAGYFAGVRTDSDFLGLGYTRNPGYARFDLSVNYTFYRGFSIYARATNLFDKSYQDALGYPALGRDARIGVRYRFTGRD